MASAYYFSKQCFAYKRLKQQIGQQCMAYSKLRKDGELGSIPGMYETTKDGRKIPAETGAAPLLRGGITITMASFEAFLQDLLEEALDNMKYKRCDADLDAKQKHYMCPKCRNNLDHKHLIDTTTDERPDLPDSVEEKKKLTKDATPRMHVWNEHYSESFELVEKTPHETYTKETVPQFGTRKLMNNIGSALKVIDEKLITIRISSLEIINKRLKPTILADQSLEQLPNLQLPQIEPPATFNNSDAGKILLENIVKKCSKNDAVDQEFKKLGNNIDSLRKHLPKAALEPDPKYYAGTSTVADYKFIEELFKDGPINYYYLIDEKWVSHMEIDNRYIICLLLNLFYGFRCIICHGNREKTLEGTLKDFPNCNDEKNKCNTPLEISEVHRLSDVYNTCIKQQGKDKVLKTARKLPKKKPIENLGRDTEDAKEGLELLKKYFPNNDVVEWEDERYSEKALLNENYALFHLFRVHHWLTDPESAIEAYVTYHMLVRMNQFVLLLAHRMRFAVAKIMMDQPDALVKDGIWGVPKGDTERKAKIRRFEEKHQRRVKEIQKLTSCQT